MMFCYITNESGSWLQWYTARNEGKFSMMIFIAAKNN